MFLQVQNYKLAKLSRKEVPNHRQAKQQEIRMERIQVSHGRTIRVVSVFPENGRCSPEEKLKALIDLEIQQQKLCA